ncbi:SDR family NAD(P)-dependent oxidoreductase [Actinomycetospora endophytica]|uniref:SDR family NAD(P)-dependent oxidoreductase n=1 Tax=Actinomycetospora endophytica TaxID=2291215 RepID=A0ABS8PF45_9PSEU|nr:SDR family NAD(P)-dependent oxidoreductase [Actinomycetospora endophytica]MCD2196890.1 SDR family NAD(P)-dependent oxidoreductase [Actinomycetospora endophytica]
MSTQRPLAMVTGGSAGIGFELAAQLAGRGYDVAISGQSTRVHDSAERLREYGVEAYPLQADAATYDGVEAFWSHVADLGRPIAVACLNVGVGVGGASFAETDLDAELRMIGINCSGLVHMAKRVVRAMRTQQGERRILVVSSTSATTPTPYEPVYGPTKAFGFSFAESIREELRDEGIIVTALLPGATDSEFHANAGMGDTRFGDNSWKNDRTLVAQQGIEALLAGDDHVVGGDDATKQQVIDNRAMSEPEKATRQGALARPDQAPLMGTVTVGAPRAR